MLRIDINMNCLLHTCLRLCSSCSSGTARQSAFGEQAQDDQVPVSQVRGTVVTSYRQMIVTRLEPVISRKMDDVDVDVVKVTSKGKQYFDLACSQWSSK